MTTDFRQPPGPNPKIFFLNKRKIIKQVRKKKTSCWRNVIPTSISGMTSFLSFYLALIFVVFIYLEATLAKEAGETTLKQTT
jgi:hypothetical protein